MNRVQDQAIPEAVVELCGDIAPDLAEYARHKVAGVLRHTGRAVLHVHVRVERHGDPARDRPVTAQVNVDLDGRPVRVHVAATRPREAVDMLVERLDHRLERVSRNREPRRERADPGNELEWQTDPRRPKLPHPPTEPEIIRHTTISPRRCSIDDAVTEMDDLDLDFHLFVEAGSGQDAVVYREGPTDLRFARVDGSSDAADTANLTVSPHPAPLLDTAEAVDRLLVTGLPFVFYLDADHGRANVIYHRYDGHYGLIDPPADSR